MIELKHDAAQLLAFDCSIESDKFKSWVMQYVNEDQFEAVLLALKSRALDQVIILQDLEVPYELKGKGIGTKLLKEFLQTYKQHDIILIAEAFGTNLVNLESWYGKYQFQTVCPTMAGPLMLYKL